MTNPIRIAFVITELDVGGAERCVVNLATGIDRRRFEPIVCSLGPRPLVERMELVEKLETASIPTHFLNAGSSWGFMRCRKRLTALLRMHQTQLVQTFLFHANVLGTLAARAARISHVVTGIRVADPPRWRLLVERYCSRKADRIVCVSDTVAEFVRERGRFPADRLQVIPNGVDLSQFPAKHPADLTQYGIANGSRVLVCVGRLHHQKGIDWLLESASQLFRRLPDSEILIVGDGPDRQALSQLVNTCGASERIHFAGWQPDVPGILAASDVLVLPSRWEGMPNVLLEAMASRMPVVATRVEGIEQVLGPLASEQTIQFGDTAALVEAVANLAEQPPQAEGLGKQNRARIADDFSLEAMIAQYESLYSTLAATQ